MIRPIFCLALLILCSAGHAAQAPEELGRLFFTPPQRLQLDVARQQRSRTVLASEEAATPVALPQDVVLRGVVRRGDGKSVVWFNDRPPIGESDGTLKFTTSDRADIAVKVPQATSDVKLRVGQRVELGSGRVEETYALRKSDAAQAAKAAPTLPGKTAAERRRRTDDRPEEPVSDRSAEAPAAESKPQ